MFNKPFISFICGLTIGGFSYGAVTALEAATKITGEYQGEWAMYALKEGKAIEFSKWKDKLTASNPTLLKDRAQVSVVDIMTFPDGSVRKSEFVEGYLANPDGSAGDRFYEIQGTTVPFKRLTKDDWAFHTTVSAWELPLMGFDPKTVLSSSHVTVKTTTYEGEMDTDHVTRTTTVQWKTAEGLVKNIQFVSMKGFHTRTGN